ncbi:hypothetical protein T12_6621 [Trichinella patagoniensis]|uniref:Uncharacterized protein n=1 Tax=Trichinella patagoniensis TaxID=990121 RepID=A0A0V0YZK0_9BILA|nr:hypothetical protein T12_6621 [Trichinella patagoniensis]
MTRATGSSDISVECTLEILRRDSACSSLYIVSLLLSCFDPARLPTPFFLTDRTNRSQAGVSNLSASWNVQDFGGAGSALNQSRSIVGACLCVVNKKLAKYVETPNFLKVAVTCWVDDVLLLRLNDVVIDSNDVRPTLSVPAWPRMPLMSSSGDASSSSSSNLGPGHHTMFARSVCNG